MLSCPSNLETSSSGTPFRLVRGFIANPLKKNCAYLCLRSVYRAQPAKVLRLKICNLQIPKEPYRFDSDPRLQSFPPKLLLALRS
jgi:hypothetical protein